MQGGKRVQAIKLDLDVTSRQCCNALQCVTDRVCNSTQHKTCSGCNALKHETSRGCNAPQLNAEEGCSAQDCHDHQFQSKRKYMCVPLPAGLILHRTLTLARLWTVLELNFFAMDSGTSRIVKLYYVFVRLKEASVKMVDTSTAVSVISECLYKRRFKSVKLSQRN